MLAVLPTSTKETELYRMASEAAQRAVQAAIRLLDDVACRRRPERSIANTKFLAAVRCGMSYLGLSAMCLSRAHRRAGLLLQMLTRRMETQCGESMP